MKVFKRLLASFLVAIMIIGVVPLGGFIGLDLSLKSAASSYKTGDLVTFGTYPQTLVTDSETQEILAGLQADSKGMVFYNDQGYMEYNGDFYSYEPITWRVLSVDSDGLYIMAENLLDCQQYHAEYDYITWGESTLRTWLNNDFYNLAFSFSEKKKINKTYLINDDNPVYGTEGGENTYDYVFIPSLSDVLDSTKGFSTEISDDNSRKAVATDFAKRSLLISYGGGGSYWWLRTSGSNGRWACYTNYYGRVYRDGRKVNNATFGIRPALKLSLKSSIYEAKELSNYQLRIVDDVTGKPISSAAVTFNNVTEYTSYDGTALISTSEVASNTAAIRIVKDGYFNLNVRLYELNPYALNTISLEDEENSISTTFEDVFLSYDVITGPNVELLGKTFPLFSCNTGINIPLSKITKLNVSTENDTKNKTVKYILGVNPGYTLDTDIKRNEDYQNFKSFYKLFSNAPNQKVLDKYNSLRRKLKDGNGSLGFECGITFAGYLEYSYATESLVLKEGGIVVLAESAVSTDVPLSNIGYATFKLGGETEGKISVSQTSEGALGVSSTVGISFVPSMGIGAKAVSKDIASIEAGIDGRITGSVTIPSPSLEEAFSATLSAQCYLKVKALWLFENKWSTNYPAYELYPNFGGIQLDSDNGNIVSIDEDDLELIDRSYLDNIKLDSVSTSTDGLNEESVYPYGCPQLVELDDGRVVAIYVHDDATKSDANRTTLYYSICDEGIWCTPSPVFNSGLADFQAEVCTDGEKIYAVWLRASEVYDDSYSTDDIVDKTELVFAEFDGATWTTPVVIDTADKYQMMYSIAHYNGSVSVAWAENSLNCYTLDEGETSVIYKTYLNEEWSDENIVCTKAGITDVSVGYARSIVKVAYSVDSDGDFTTTGDSELFVNSTQLTSNDADESELSYQNGLFCWILDGELCTYNPTKSSYTTTGLKIKNDYRILNNGSDTAVAYLETDGFTNELMISYLVDNEYTNPVQLTNYGKHITYYSAILNDDCSVLLLADMENLSGNVDAYPYTTTDMVCDTIYGITDLGISDVTYDGLVIRNGEVIFTGNIKNSGTAAVESYTVNFKDSSGNTVYSEAFAQTMSPGETTSFSITYLIPSDFTKQDITAEVVAADDKVSGNNTSPFTMGYADVEFVNVSISESGLLTGVIENKGYESAQNVRVSVEAVSDTDVLLSELNAGTIGIGETKEVSYQIPAENLTFDSVYDINKFRLITETDTQEENLGNNDIEVIHAPKAVEGITLSSTELLTECGQKSQLTATIYPSDAYNKKVHWVSDSIDVATVDENGNVTTVGTGTAIITALTDAGDFISQCEVNVIGIRAQSTAKIDFDKNIAYGFVNPGSLDGYFSVIDENCTLSYDNISTDSTIKLLKNSQVVAEYTIIIFGDVNGDGWYDGQDAVLVSCLANGMLTKDDVSEAVYMAADCNHDGVIDALDVALLEQAGLLLANVDQTKSSEELATDEAYVEYISLIDQTPDVEDEPEDIPDADDTTPEQEEISILDLIIKFIKSIIEMILSRIPVPYK